MADEEKPTAEEAAAQPTGEVTDAAETSSDGQDSVDDTQEAVEAIAKNVQERAAEIEDVLADASAPSALVKTPSPESEDALPAVEQLMEPPKAKAAEAESASEGEEPNLQISVGGERVRISTAHPMIEEIAEQLQKSRQFTMYSVGGLCTALLGAVLFYVLMAAQLSSKVGEIDAMLGAMAKRTIQMTRGIETFSAIEMRLDEGLANQLAQREMLAANEIAMVELNEALAAVPSDVTNTTASALTQTQQALAGQLLQLQNDNKALGQALTRLQQALDAQSAEVSSIRGVRRELSTMRSSMQQVEATVADLYIIERARVAKQVLGAKEDL
jgi:hypothetical protein